MAISGRDAGENGSSPPQTDGGGVILRAIITAAHSAHDRREWAEAAAAYAAFIHSGGPEVDVLLALGDVQAEAGDLEQALASYGRLRTHKPADAVAAFRLGSLALRLKDVTLARDALRDAHRLADGPLSSEIKLRPVPELLNGAEKATLAAAGYNGSALTRFSDGGGEQAQINVLGPLVLSRSSPSRVVAMLVDGALRPGISSTARVLDAFDAIRSGSLVAVICMGENGGQAQAKALAQLAAARRIPALILQDRSETGARRSLNLALALAISWGADVSLIMADDADPRTLQTSTAVDSDPMVGFITQGGGPSRSFYGPSALSPLVEVRARVLAETGLLDAVYDRADAAVLDLMLRANRLGFSTVAAQGTSRATAQLNDLDAQILRQRHPDHRRVEVLFANGPDATANWLAAAMCGRPRMLLDLSSLDLRHDGTAEFSARVSRELARDQRIDVHLLCRSDVARFHGLLDHDQPLRIVEPHSQLETPFTVCFKPSQPLAWPQLTTTWNAAPVAGFLMLDTISLDVEELDVHDLRPLLRLALDNSELVGHLSRFTREQFARRFGSNRQDAFVALPSTAADEYTSFTLEDGARSGVLLVGNHYGHKNLRKAIDEIRDKLPTLGMTVLGPVLSDELNVRWIQAGSLDPKGLAALYSKSEAVVFPSLYEGFGLPIMHALAHQRPVAAIDAPVFRELAERTMLRSNLHLFPSTASLAEGLNEVRTSAFRVTVPLLPEQRWADTSRTIVDAALKAVSTFNFNALLRRTTLASLLHRKSAS